MFFDTRVSIQSGPGSQYLPDADVKGVKTGISGKIHNDFLLKICPVGTKCSLIAFNFQLLTFNSPWGLIVKNAFPRARKTSETKQMSTHFFGPKNGVVPLFRYLITMKRDFIALIRHFVALKSDFI